LINCNLDKLCQGMIAGDRCGYNYSCNNEL